ncbi:MAG TPA: imidazolonepropionase [Actinomycetota bacterium]|nr:imidazolonepropionase [Actinomycetota bacterium]
MLVEHIGELVTNDPAHEGPLGIIHDAAVAIDGDRIAWVGEQGAAPDGVAGPVVDADGGAALPGFVDSHTHLVFAGDRTAEFDARMRGERYATGGIKTTVAATRAASDDELRANARRLREEALRTGTTHVEIKSGYGLDVDDEARLLTIAGELTDDVTFLGGHVVAPEYAGEPDDYVDLVRGAMLDACAPLARWADVFCEKGAFDEDQSRAILTAAKDKGLGLRIHANQLEPGPGARLAAELGAASADHLTHLGPGDAEALASAGVVATLVPVADLSTRSPWPDARALLDAGATVALATDCNPGTSFTTNMPVVIALAVTAMRMTPAEAVWSATAGSARALQRVDVGTLQQGARADLAILDAPSHVHLAYRPGVPIVRTVISAGSVVHG